MTAKLRALDREMTHYILNDDLDRAAIEPQNLRNLL
jgi:hypothetical protein